MSASLLLDLVLILLLATTLVQAIRLERTLGSLRRDRTELERMIAGFDGATRQAEAGLDRLRDAADGAGRHLARQVERAAGLQQDLDFLSGRGDKLADRLEMLVRLARTQLEEPARATPTTAASPARQEAERDLLRILQATR